MKIKIGDMVKVITGKDKGKTGKVVETLRKDKKIVVEGVNVCKKHQKPNNNNENGGIIQISLPIHISNVKRVEKETEKTTKKEAKKVEKKAK